MLESAPQKPKASPGQKWGQDWCPGGAEVPKGSPVHGIPDCITQPGSLRPSTRTQWEAPGCDWDAASPDTDSAMLDLCLSLSAPTQAVHCIWRP